MTIVVKEPRHNKLEKMTKSITFSNKKARHELTWEPLDVLENYEI